MSKVLITFTWKLLIAKNKAYNKTMKMMIKQTKKSQRVYKDPSIACTLEDKGMSYIFTITGKEKSIEKIYKKQLKASKKRYNKAIAKAVGKMTVKKVK